MRKFSPVFVAATLGILLAQPVWARTCPKLIKEGRDLLAKTKISKVDSDKIKTLLDDSEKLHESGDHAESMKKAREALSLLKKK